MSDRPRVERTGACHRCGYPRASQADLRGFLQNVGRWWPARTVAYGAEASRLGEVLHVARRLLVEVYGPCALCTEWPPPAAALDGHDESRSSWAMVHLTHAAIDIIREADGGLLGPISIHALACRLNADQPGTGPGAAVDALRGRLDVHGIDLDDRALVGGEAVREAYQRCLAANGDAPGIRVSMSAIGPPGALPLGHGGL